MASGHVNRIYRPNTWLHRPMLQNVKKALANSEPSTHGTKRTWRSCLMMSVHRGKADIANVDHERPCVLPAEQRDPLKKVNPCRRYKRF
jgi:hypothetical protein